MYLLRMYGFLLILLSSSAFADLNLLPYQNARIMYQSQGDVDEYSLALGSYKKTQGAWVADREERLTGNLTRYTLELPDNHTADNGFDFYVDQLKNFNYRELFHCLGRDCGTSNSWANNHFKIQQLYGLDQYQQYGAYEVTTAEAIPFYVAIYSVQRGNRRVYMQVDVLQTKKVLELGVASSPETLVKALSSSGYYVFPDAVSDDGQGNTLVKIKEAHLNALIEVMLRQAFWKVALVGHDYAPVGLLQQQRDSQSYAVQLKKALVAKGVAQQRISTYGVGSLAPAGRGDRSARVEVVKLADSE